MEPVRERIAGLDLLPNGSYRVILDWGNWRSYLLTRNGVYSLTLETSWDDENKTSVYEEIEIFRGGVSALPALPVVINIVGILFVFEGFWWWSSRRANPKPQEEIYRLIKLRQRGLISSSNQVQGFSPSYLRRVSYCPR
jgi:hypothetical protein